MCIKPWVWSLGQNKVGKVAHAYNPALQQVEAGGSEIQPWLHRQFEATLD